VQRGTGIYTQSGCCIRWLWRRAAAGAQAQSGERKARSKRANAVAGRLVVPSQNAAMGNSRLAPAETGGRNEQRAAPSFFSFSAEASRLRLRCGLL
jgi:hypothetical protein